MVIMEEEGGLGGGGLEVSMRDGKLKEMGRDEANGYRNLGWAGGGGAEKSSAVVVQHLHKM